ncbi:hypothetical protein B0H19DRAFT_1187037, partial [Mycena capillaripes]
MPVELFHIWLSRSGNLPLSLHCRDVSEAGALLEASLAYSHQWQDVKFTISSGSFQKLNLRHTSLPMLRSISIDVSSWINEPTPERVIIQGAPILREAHLSTPPHLKFDIPWPQLTALTLRHSIDLVECISLLRGCPDLVILTVQTVGTAIPHTDFLTLHFLESFSCRFGDPSILELLTLPRLERLTVTGGDVEHAAVLEAFIRRSTCPLRFFSYSCGDLVLDSVLPCLHALPDSVSQLELIANSSRGFFQSNYSLLSSPWTFFRNLKSSICEVV